jgi:hypothetical protein
MTMTDKASKVAATWRARVYGVENNCVSDFMGSLLLISGGENDVEEGQNL